MHRSLRTWFTLLETWTAGRPSWAWLSRSISLPALRRWIGLWCRARCVCLGLGTDLGSGSSWGPVIRIGFPTIVWTKYIQIHSTLQKFHFTPNRIRIIHPCTLYYLNALFHLLKEIQKRRDALTYIWPITMDGHNSTFFFLKKKRSFLPTLRLASIYVITGCSWKGYWHHF